jgi:hypothetical protein
LNSSTRDENAVTITPDSQNWALVETSENLGNTENSTWQIPINHGTGQFTINYSVSKQWYDSNYDTSTIEIWTKANITLYSPLDATYDRGNSITYYANVTDHYNNTPVPGYECRWWLDGVNIANTTTDSNGTCSWTWSTSCANPTRDYAGLHTVNSTIGSNASIFYDPNVNNSYTSTTLKGFLRIVIDSPQNNSIWHKTDSLWLNSTVKDECSQNIAAPTVNWTLNNTEYINTGVNVSWTIPADHERGNFFLNATANKTYYHSTSNTSNIEIWGWSNVSWISPSSGTYNHTQILTLVCRVIDANSSASISDYVINFWKNEEFFGNNSTDINGNASLIWDTTPESLGTYNWKCNITDNSTQFYNVSIEESTATLTLQDVISPNITDTNLLPTPPIAEIRSIYSSGENITIQANITDDIGVSYVWAEITLPNTTKVNVSMLNVVGNTYRGNYTPEIGGEHNVTIFANDTSGNVNSSYVGTFVAYNQTTAYVEQEQYIIIPNITLTNSQNVTLNLTAKNTGNTTAYNLYIKLYRPGGTNWLIDSQDTASVSKLCGNVSKGESCFKLFNITIPELTSPANYTLNGTLTWTNPDGTTPSSLPLNHTIINVTANPILK